MTATATRWRAYADLALAMTAVGTIVPASKVIGAAFSPFLASALRLALAACVLVPWAARRHSGALAVWRHDGHDRLLLVIQAAAGTVGFTVLLLLGTARTTATEASIVAGTLPAVAAGVSALLFRERPGPRRLLALALATTAVGVLHLDGGDAAARARLLGDLLVLGAVTSESLFILLQKRLHRGLPPLVQSAVMSVLGFALVLLPATIEARQVDFSSIGARAWLAIAWYGLVPTVLGFFLWYRGAERVAGSQAAVFTALMPLAGAAASALVLGEALGLVHLGALALVMAAIALAA